MNYPVCLNQQDDAFYTVLHPFHKFSAKQNDKRILSVQDQVSCCGATGG